jgi:hypothetical protein
VHLGEILSLGLLAPGVESISQRSVFFLRAKNLKYPTQEAIKGINMQIIYRCSYCSAEFETEKECLQCEDEHTFFNSKKVNIADITIEEIDFHHFSKVDDFVIPADLTVKIHDHTFTYHILDDDFYDPDEKYVEDEE